METHNNLLEKIGDNIRSFRNIKGMSQQVLGDVSNVAKSTIKRIESGKLNPTILMLQKIASTLEIGLDELIKIR